MTINRHVSENYSRGHTMRQRIGAGVLTLALAFTSGCGLMNRQYLQSERDAGSDIAAQVDASPSDMRLPAGVIDADLDARLTVDAGSEDEPLPATQDDSIEPPACPETRFNMHYNSTNFVDENSEVDIAAFITDIAAQGHDRVYVVGFASVENRGDRINNDAPYNDWLAEQRALRVVDVIRQVVEEEGLDLDVASRSYAETDKLGPRLEDNRSVVLTTRALPDIDEIANAAIAEEIRSNVPNSVYGVECCDDDQIGEEVARPSVRHAPRASPAPRPHATAAPVAHTPVVHAPAAVIPAPTYSPEPAVAPAAVTPAPTVQPAPVQQTPEPVAPAPIIAPSGAVIHFGVDPLPHPAVEPAADGFMESGPISVPPTYQGEHQGEQAPDVEVPATPAEPVTPAPAVVPSAKYDGKSAAGYISSTEDTIASLQQSVNTLAGTMLSYTNLATSIEAQCGPDGYGNSLCNAGYEAQCGEDNDPRTPSELGETTVCREAYISLDQGLDIAQADLEYIESRIEKLQTAGLPSTLEEAIADLSASVRGLEEAMSMYDVPVVPASYQGS